ncbi:hypothetical protein HELRODRAFT_180407 [Helobdella robusta]|uniref:Uncharacterized protein n=1 Tax=Helobdella robusta TaxID=6412 RepID=T1FFW1_HELRO|nr:hypothetical protein HELRODRAFT_180407 [Helobdella robusta]ESN93987.1 hypothetical protein HELRODRAFT_180407 [Helobdella robusta]
MYFTAIFCFIFYFVLCLQQSFTFFILKRSNSAATAATHQRDADNAISGSNTENEHAPNQKDISVVEPRQSVTATSSRQGGSVGGMKSSEEDAGAPDQLEYIVNVNYVESDDGIDDDDEEDDDGENDGGSDDINERKVGNDFQTPDKRSQTLEFIPCKKDEPGCMIKEEEEEEESYDDDDDGGGGDGDFVGRYHVGDDLNKYESDAAKWIRTRNGLTKKYGDDYLQEEFDETEGNFVVNKFPTNRKFLMSINIFGDLLID